MKRRRLLGTDEENDPMSVVGNLFDVAMVFAVALTRTPARRTWRLSSSRGRRLTAIPLPRTSPGPGRKADGSA